MFHVINWATSPVLLLRVVKRATVERAVRGLRTTLGKELDGASNDDTVDEVKVDPPPWRETDHPSTLPSYAQIMPVRPSFASYLPFKISSTPSQLKIIPP
ncbi:hypothetical protein RJT34_33498 [Clitoria ternatea]|uniref:Uncharacterized protein n=1 Tax=Clitoria ternatea TaxID=43366 RepID=A0AAN9F0N2_CLITE